MDREHVASLARTMRNCLFVMLGSLCVIVTSAYLGDLASQFKGDGVIGNLFGLAYGISVLASGLPVAAFVGAIVVFYFPLGKLAKLFGRSVIVWVGLTLLFSPWGHVIAYFSMREVISKELARAKATGDHQTP